MQKCGRCLQISTKAMAMLLAKSYVWCPQNSEVLLYAEYAAH